jgi:hypothetical protein
MAQVNEIALKECKKINSVPGPEDFAFESKSNTFYISSHDRRNFDSLGNIYKLDLNKENAELIKLDTKYPKNFRPHGIAISQIGNRTLLYAVSHPNLKEYKHSIEIFEIQKDKLIFLETLYSETLTSPNDLFVTEQGKIFVSNDHSSSNQFMQLIEDAFRYKGADIAYYDGKKWTELGVKLNLGNGILVRKEKNKNFIYRASTTTEKIHKYEIQNLEDKISLKEVKVYELDSGPDNLEEHEGNIIFASHKSLFRFLSHANNPKNISPSQIWLLNPESSELKEIYANKGSEISASSTGFIFKNKLYISQVFEPFLLRCDY